MKKVTVAFILLSFLVLPFTTQASEGIPLQMDVFLGSPIYGPEDLPEQITFNLYDSQGALVPLGSQTFTRGQYTVDFEFSQSDGVSSGQVARINVQFTNKLDLMDEFGEPLKPEEIWAALEVAGTEVGSRIKVSEETMVQLLLASDASMATYLTLVYEGDDNPLTTIYKTLPLSSDGSQTSLSSYFSAVAGGADDREFGSLTEPYWEKNSNKIYYNDGYIGVGTNNPSADINIQGNSGYAKVIIKDTTTDSHPGFSLRNDAYRYDFRIDGSNNDIFEISDITAGVISRLAIANSGNIGIGTVNPTEKLAVNGTILCKELMVTTDASKWPDFVFEESYELPSLAEVEGFIKQNKRLPGLPSQSEVQKSGVSLGKVSSKLLQKIEELTLYVINLKKQNEVLSSELTSIKKQLHKGSN